MLPGQHENQYPSVGQIVDSNFCWVRELGIERSTFCYAKNYSLLFNQMLPNDLLIMDMSYESRRMDNWGGGDLEGKGKAGWEGIRTKYNDMQM